MAVAIEVISPSDADIPFARLKMAVAEETTTAPQITGGAICPCSGSCGDLRGHENLNAQLWRSVWAHSQSLRLKIMKRPTDSTAIKNIDAIKPDSWAKPG